MESLAKLILDDFRWLENIKLSAKALEAQWDANILSYIIDFKKRGYYINNVVIDSKFPLPKLYSKMADANC